MRYSRALVSCLALSFAFSGEGFRLRRAGEQDVAAGSQPDIQEPSLAHEDTDISSVEDEEEVDDEEMEDMDEQEDTVDEEDAKESFSDDGEEVEEEVLEEQDAGESSFIDGKLDGVASAGKCSANDRKVLKKHKGNGKTSQGAHSAKCGRSSYSIFSGMDKKGFSKCLRGKVKISTGCGGCYANMADWSSKNCKMACISSWCSSGCLKCTKKNQKALDRCTGFTMFKVNSC